MVSCNRSTAALVFALVGIGLGLLGTFPHAVSADRVIIRNHVGQDITAHCSSKDNDLGVHTIPDQSDWFFKFGENIFDSTLFMCHFTWPATGKSISFVTFSHDLKEETMPVTCSNCLWTATPSGWTVWNKQNRTDVLVYEW